MSSASGASASKKRPRPTKPQSYAQVATADIGPAATSTSSSSSCGSSLTVHDADAHARMHLTPSEKSRVSGKYNTRWSSAKHLFGSVLFTLGSAACLQGRLAAASTAEPPLISFPPAEDAEVGDDEDGGMFVEQAPVSELIALMPRAIAALSEQARTGEDGEPLDGCNPVLLASNVPLATFNALLSSEMRPKASLLYDATSGSVFIYELPKDGHDAVSRKISFFFGCYSQAQAGRRVPPTVDDFRFLGTTDVNLGPNGNRQPDESFRADASVHAAVPVLIVEICHAQTLAQGDARAQAWLLCPDLGFLVQAVLVVKYWPRHRDGTFAAVAVLYEQGGGPGAIARTVNLVGPLGVAAPQVHVPGVPPMAVAAPAGAVAAQLPVLLPVAGNVAVTPIAPTRVVSFGTASPWAGEAMRGVIGLGTSPEGVGFSGAAGLCHGAACDAVGVPGYALRVPASRLYFGVPPCALPAGLQPDPLTPDLVNDFHLDLFLVSHVLNRVLAGT